MSKKEDELKEQLIRLQNYYKILNKKYENMVEERTRRNKLIDKQASEIRRLKKQLKGVTR